jgi:hypothetical protein
MNSSTLEAELEVAPVRAIVTEHHLVVDLADGRTVSAPLTWYPRLAHGTPTERANVEIWPDSLEWPDLDEQISVRGLLLGRKSGEGQPSLNRWLEYRARGEKVPVPTLPLPPDMEAELRSGGDKTE